MTLDCVTAFCLGGHGVDRGCCVPTLTQHITPLGSVNEYLRKLGSKRAYHKVNKLLTTTSDLLTVMYVHIYLLVASIIYSRAVTLFELDSNLRVDRMSKFCVDGMRNLTS